MSWDLEIFGQSNPLLADAVADLTSAFDRAHVSVRLNPDGDGLALQDHADGCQICRVDGPFAVDEASDYVPDPVRSSLLQVCWTMQISSPSALSAGQVEVVERLARRLAERTRGLVYDPQEERVVWPRNVTKLRAIESTAHTEAKSLALEFVLARNVTRSDADAILTILRRKLPEALPVRFGDFEPLQGRVDRDGDVAFAALFDEPRMFFWTGHKPFLRGYVASSKLLGARLTPEEREARTPVVAGRPAIATDSVVLKFRPQVASDRYWLSAIETVFKELATALGAFVGAAYLDCGISTDVLSAKYWLGLPREPRWLFWVAGPYLNLLPSNVPPNAKLSNDHVFVRAGDTPLAAATGDQIGWDVRLIRRGRANEHDLAATLIPPMD